MASAGERPSSPRNNGTEARSSGSREPCREELITRNVAKLVEPPRTDTPELLPSTLDETLDFLTGSRKDPLSAAFVLAIAMGLRRGEIVGLRWSDVDLDNRVLYVRH